VAEDIVQNVRIDGVAEAATAFDKLAAAGESAFNRLRSAGERVGNIGAGIDEAGRAGPQLTDLERRGEALGRSIGETAKRFGTFGVAVAKASAAAGAAAGGGMFALALAASKVTERVRDAAIQAGITAEQFGRLKFAAEQSGTSAGGLSRAFAIINSGSTEVEKGLAKFNVRLRDGAGNVRNANEVLLEFADAIKGISDPSQRAAAAAEVFGRRAGPQLVELLSEGSKGITALGKEADRLGITFSKAEVEVGDKFGDAASKLGGVLTGLSTRIGLAFSPKLIEIMDRLSESIARVAPFVIKAADAIANTLLPPIIKLMDILGPIGTAIGVAVLALGALALGVGAVIAVLGPLAGLLRLAFLPFTLLIPVITAGFGLIVSAIGTIITAVTTFGAVALAAFGPIAPIVLAIAAAIGALIVLLARVDWAAFGEKAVGVWQSIKDIAGSVAEFITSAWNTAWETVSTAAQTAFQFITDAIQPVLDFIQQGIDLATRFAAALSGALTGSADASGDSVGAFARGGPVRGPGTSTSDSILARLSRGEFVVRTKAVDKYGLGLLNAINSMRLPVKALRGFANGGFVDAMGLSSQPRYAYAEGGPVQTGRRERAIVLQLGGERFDMVTADSDTADRLVRYATTRRVKAAGRKPSYTGV
jgi:hypothetical protein